MLGPDCGRQQASHSVPLLTCSDCCPERYSPCEVSVTPATSGPRYHFSPQHRIRFAKGSLYSFLQQVSICWQVHTKHLVEVLWEAVRSDPVRSNRKAERPVLLLMGMTVCDDDQISLQLCQFSLEKNQQILEVLERLENQFQYLVILVSWTFVKYNFS